jgi:signal transduction histidine kinase/CheY-like chemotaxis protein
MLAPMDERTVDSIALRSVERTIDEVFANGGETGALLREIDWSKHPFGPVGSWAQSLCTLLSTVLSAPYASALIWGTDASVLYNDACIRFYGDAHPAALGMPLRLAFPPVWKKLEPFLTEAFRSGRSVHFENESLLFEIAAGQFEETWWNLACVPARGEDGAVVALRCSATDLTRQVLAERRLRVLRYLAEATTAAPSVQASSVGIEAALAGARPDVEAALLYAPEESSPNRFRLLVSSGVPHEIAASPEHAARWPLAQVSKSAAELLLEPLDVENMGIPRGAWPEGAMRVTCVPVAWPHGRAVLVVGLDPKRRFDDEYRDFIRQLATQVGTAMANAHALELERQRSAALAAAHRELKLADQRKDEFLAMLAHELRNPIAAVNTALALLERDDDPTRSARHRETAQRQVGSLVRLVDDLLDVARITRGAIELRKTFVDLGRVVQRGAAAVRPMIESHQQTLTVTIDPGPFTAYADATRIEQVLVNLLTNAMKYTDTHGSIAVGLERELVDGKPFAVLRVRDNGRGIPADMLDGIFHTFAQVAPTLDRQTGGLGLGLALVQRITIMHGGSVGAESEGVGHGSEFVVRLPLTPQVVAETTEPLRQTLHPVQPRRVVVIEDNDDARELLQEYLERIGHDVSAAANGTDGMTMLLDQKPDVALVDVGLPGLDGYEVARRVRAEATYRPYLVALTGYGGADAESLALSAGFDRHLVKPVNLDLLAGLISTEGHPSARRR